jgi:prepilin-type N-terminal cleavage/methylation domain-containing protein
MKSAIHTTYYRAGFTLVEIMIGVAIIALLAALALPGFQRARKRSIAGRTLEELRVLEYAIGQYAIETGKKAGDVVSFNDVRLYLKPSTPLYVTGKDYLGNDYGPNFTVDIYPKVPAATFSDLQDVAPTDFWRPYNQ